MKKKIKKLWQSKFLKNYLILILSFLYLEICFRLISNLKIISYDFLRIFLSINIIALLLGFIFSFLPKIINKILNGVIILGVAIYGIVELGFKGFIGSYISIGTSSQAGAVKSYIGDFIRSFKPIYYILLIPFILLLVYYIFIDKKVTLDLPKRKKSISYIIARFTPVLLIILGITSYYFTLKLDFMQNKTQAVKSYDLFLKPTNPSLAVNDFGYIGFGILDVKEYFLPGKEINTDIDYNPNLIPNTSVTAPSKFGEEEKKEHLDIDNEIWKEIITSEKNNNYNTLNKYFISNESTFTNKYTGLFEGKNLIMIMLESGSNLALNKELYPNLSKIYNEGWNFANYYSPRNSCSTGNNEMSGMISLYSINNTCTANLYADNKYFESIFNLFNNEGYTTNSFHDHYDQYYYRTEIHKNMGSNKFYKVQDMNIYYSYTYGDWASDIDLMNFYLSKLDERETNEPFMSWITTVTTHMPYSSPSKYNDLYESTFNEEYSKDVRRYMSKLKVVDEAIGVLLEGLEERNLLDDTVIVLYADHYPYGLQDKDLTEALGYEVNIDNNADQVPFLIYNPSLKGTTFDEYATYIDITPTIANLFNLSYDSRIYMGKDILSDEFESMVVFPDGSWKNAVGFYDASTNFMKYYTKKVYSDEELLAINEKISLKLKMSSLAIRTNYFNYLDKKLNSYTTSTN